MRAGSLYTARTIRVMAPEICKVHVNFFIGHLETLFEREVNNQCFGPRI